MISDVEVRCFIHFDTETLVGKKMPEFLMMELLTNARTNCQRIQDTGQMRQNKI